MRLELEAPEKANEVMGQIIAEMRELRARDEQPAVVLQLAGEETITSSGDGAGHRDDQLFRLAVRR